MSRATSLSELAGAGSMIHLVGIGGAGMAGLALLLQARGARVSGCDAATSEASAELLKRGIEVHRGHDPGHVNAATALVHTSAVMPDHAELEAARALGVPVLKRSEAMAELVNDGSLVAVSGTHGKTTTTALAALALESAGLDPTALVGGRVAAWGGHARIGRSEHYVVEADEYDRSFLTLRPRVAVVTSVEEEHLDTYETYADLEAAFDLFISQVSEDGRVVVCSDDPGARRRLEKAGSRGLAYGLARDAELVAESIQQTPHTSFSARWRDEPLGEFQLGLRGLHNVRNALAVIGVMLALGLEPQTAAPALSSFSGVDRRFQVLGDAGGVTVLDDYAHHPTEVTATLETARTVYAGRRLVVAFQPHLYSRTRAFAEEFGRALAMADLAFVTEVYPARERPIPGVSSRLVVDAARRSMASDDARYAPDLFSLTDALREELGPGDVFLTLGAGDIFEVAHRLFAEMSRSDVES